MLKDPLTLLGILERLANLLRADLRRIGTASSLQAVHLQALIYLAHCNRFSNTPQALADYLGLTKGTVSQSLLLLDRRGLIERYEDEQDRRVVRLRLAESGLELLAAAGLHDLWRGATREVSASRIRTAVSTLREVLFLLQAEAGAANFGTCETCVHFERRSVRIYHCDWYAERLTLGDSRLLCRSHAPRTAGSRRSRGG